MTRKERKSVTPEILGVIKRMLEDESLTVKEIARMVNLSNKTISRIKKNIYAVDQGALNSDASEQRIHINALSIENQIIKNMISCNNDFTLKEISENLYEKTNAMLSISTISRRLKILGITRKRLSLIPIERNSQDKIDLRSIYATEVFEYGIDHLVFLDETGFNKHNSRHYGYSPINVKAYKYVPANRGKNHSCLAVISYEGLVKYELKQGAYNTVFFAEFIQNYLIDYFRENSHKVLIMDNVRFHHSREVLSLLTTNNIAYKFLPPYSPQLNPIEEFFSMIKSRYAAMHSTNDDVIESTLEQIFSPDYSSQCRSFYQNMERWLEKALQKEEFI